MPFCGLLRQRAVEERARHELQNFVSVRWDHKKSRPHRPTLRIALSLPGLQEGRVEAVSFCHRCMLMQTMAMYSLKLSSDFEGFFWWRWRYVMFFQPFRSITPMWSWWMRAHDGRKPLERRWILVDGTSCFHCGVWTLAGGYARSSWKICTSAKRKLLIGMGWGLTRNVWVTSQFLMAF